MKTNAKRYRLVLEEVTGPDDDCHIEIKATWDLKEWRRNFTHLLASVKESYTSAKAGR